LSRETPSHFTGDQRFESLFFSVSESGSLGNFSIVGEVVRLSPGRKAAGIDSIVTINRLTERPARPLDQQGLTSRKSMAK
jgi:hypothetical protein